MLLLVMFMIGVILDNALILRRAFLIMPSTCSLKFNLVSTLIPNRFLQLVFLISKGPINTYTFSFLLKD